MALRRRVFPRCDITTAALGLNTAQYCTIQSTEDRLDLAGIIKLAQGQLADTRLDGTNFTRVVKSRALHSTGAANPCGAEWQRAATPPGRSLSCTGNCRGVEATTWESLGPQLSLPYLWSRPPPLRSNTMSSATVVRTSSDVRGLQQLWGFCDESSGLGKTEQRTRRLKRCSSGALW
jgi:hypothetical protein